MADRNYTARLQKGGAVLDETRIIVRNWSDDEPWKEQSQKLIKDNILGKRS